jgi:hypothetical protein
MEWRSSASFLGLPLVHVATGGLVDGAYRRGIAIGWVAVGDLAIGPLVAVGGISLGGICLGGLALGLLPLGGLALGVLAFGGLAIGMTAVGGAAVAWYTAVGGLALSHDYAIGGLALGPHVIGPGPSKSLPTQSIPRAPFRASDAWALLGVFVVLLFIAVAAQERRSE